MAINDTIAPEAVRAHDRDRAQPELAGPYQRRSRTFRLRRLRRRRGGQRSADGPHEEGFFNLVYQPLLEEDGRTSGIVVVATEVTELARARRDAEAANRAKDEFLAILGHELRNPLAPIQTALELMKLKGGNTSVRERTVIERQVKHLTRLVDDLLDVPRLTGGKITLARERVEIADSIRARSRWRARSSSSANMSSPSMFRGKASW